MLEVADNRLQIKHGLVERCTYGHTPRRGRRRRTHPTEHQGTVWRERRQPRRVGRELPGLPMRYLIATDFRGRWTRGHGGMVDTHGAERRADIVLRRERKFPREQDGSRGDRRKGVRHRVVARLGRERHDAAWRARGDRREFRAHPPFESRRHGRAAARVHR